MLTPRWRKILSDLWGNKVRTLLVVLSIMVGVAAVGMVSISFLVVRSDVQADFMASNPHDAMLYVSSFDDDFLATIAHTQGVRQVEGRSAVGGQVPTLGGQKSNITITGIPDLSQIQVDHIFLESGSPQLQDKEVYIDRGSFAALGVKEGQTISVEMPGGKLRDLRVVGVVHDAYTNSYSGSLSVSAYANFDTLEWLGGTRQYSRLVLTTQGGPRTEDYIREVSDRVSDRFKKSGREVFVTVIFHPGEHPGQQTIDAVLGLLGGMGVLILFLSTFLVINTITALLNQQIRQIGVMKAVGADQLQVMGMYLVLIMLFGIIALIPAVPLATFVAYGLAQTVAMMLNSTISAMRIPLPALILMVLVGLGVPLCAGLAPVLNGARLTVREAMNNYGLAVGKKRGLFDRMLEGVEGLPRPLLLSLRNTFRRKARLVLTLSTLTLAGAIFMAVFNVRDSMYLALDKTYGYILSDVNVDFSHGYRIERIRDVLRDVPEIKTVEGWGGTVGQAMRPDGDTGDEISIIAPPAGSQLIQPVLTAGRWLVKGDENAVVVGNHFMKLRPEVKVGDELNLRIQNKDHIFRVVGIYQVAGNFIPPVLYVNSEYLSKTLNQTGLVYSIRVLTTRHDPAAQMRIAKNIESRFRAAGMGVGGVVTGGQISSGSRTNTDILIYVLLGMAVLIAIVGGLGLMGTMTMNVLERTREIGVMRSIGAVNGAIMQLVIVEGMIIGVISWGLGALLSIPITNALDTLLGVSLLMVPLDYTFSMQGLVTWVIIALVLSAVSSILPARNAVRLTVRDVLAYE